MVRRSAGAPQRKRVSGSKHKIGGSLKNAIKSAGDKAKYDASCKGILKERMVLAHILKETVPEYANCQIKDIANQYIEPDTIRPDVPVSRNLTNILGLSEEDAAINEGTVRFDVKFLAKSPLKEKGTLITLFFDVEAQKDRTDYPIEKRAEFYGARVLSAQVGDITENIDYNALCKVYSIFICFDVPNYKANTVSRYAFAKEDVLGTCNSVKKTDYDLIQVVIIRLSKNDDLIGNNLLDLLHVLFGQAGYEEKLRQLQGLGFDDGAEKEGVEDMFSFADRLEGLVTERVTESVTESVKSQLALNMHQKGMSIEQISEIAETDAGRVRAWVMR